MAISLKRYVDITSGVGAASAVATRELDGRFFTTNPLVPTDSFVEADSAQDVGLYFGFSSDEYARAVFYFGWISKDITRPSKIQFARWANVAAAPQIFGALGTQALATWNAINNGSFNLALDGFAHALTGLDFTGSANLAAVAATIQAAVRAESNPVNFTGAIAITFPVSFTGVIAGTTLTASSVTGTFVVGQVITGAGVTMGTIITAFLGGTGGAGTYTVSASQTVSSEAMTAGAAFNTLTASNVDGILAIGQLIAGSGVTGSPTITAFGNGTGGAGTYILSTNSLTVSSELMTAGPSDPMWASATVTFDAVRGSFNFTGGNAAQASIAVTAGTSGTDIAGQLGWLSASAIFSEGSAIQSVSGVLTSSAGASNNFGSFTFMPTLNTAQILEAANWNNDQNIEFMYSIRCTAANAVEIEAAVGLIGGCTVTLAPLSTEYPEQDPMMIMSATDYDAQNSVQNYMFQIFNQTASVATDADADTYDNLSINYYGQTQTAGNLIQFYQRGVMMGLPVDPLDQNTYANEMWLKDAASASIMTLLLSQPRISANNKGRGQILAILQGVINQAVFNGTISVGKTLNDTQKLFISEQTGDPKAWYQVQNQGYWVDVEIVPYIENNVTKYKAVYTLIYSKDDVIRLVEGRDILI